MIYSPKSPWEGLQAINFDQCLYIVMVIGKCTEVFRGSWWRNLSWGEEISMKGAQDFLPLLKKKQWKYKYEEVFQLKVRSSIKL